MPLVSIIMPAYNSEKYIGSAIESVLNQQHQDFELLIINDGSTDRTSDVVGNFKDDRIIYIEQENTGVSGARNTGLEIMKGDYFCFLDSDDLFPAESLSARIARFATEEGLSFVDGKVVSYNQDLSKELSSYVPAYRGNPLKPLALLSSECFFGITWMIKRDITQIYRFDRSLKHGEDLWFFIELAQKKTVYDFVETEIYSRREVAGSAMSDIKGLGEGYYELYRRVKKHNILQPEELTAMRNRIRRILTLSFLRKKDFLNSFKSLIRRY
ncbi:MAG: glycosyltransferase family 2 protein [Cyclobacteriaceae bacterium]